MCSRADLLQTARELLRLGLVEGTQGNVSVRDGEGILITPSALPYETMVEEDLVLLDAGGRVLAGSRAPSSEWRVHAAVYAARPDAQAVVHTHSPAATAWSRSGEPLGDVLTARFASTGSPELGEHAVEALGGRDAVLLRDHGVVAVGPGLAEALATAVEIERSVTQRT